MPLGGLLLAGLAPVVGGIVGQIASGGEKDAAAKSSAQAIEYLKSVGVPSIEAQQIVMNNPEFVSQFTPEAETTQQLGSSAMENVSTDPRLAQAQMSALTSLQEQGENPLTAMEKAQLNSNRRSVASEEQARQGAILQDMAARGAGGSGAELAARLSSSQSATQRAGEQADSLAAMSQQRALQAIAAGGELGGSIRGQEFGEGTAKASAADAIAQFNAANAQNVEARNVAAKNAAGATAAATKQELEGIRANNSNQQQIYNKNLLQTNYQNQIQKASGLAGQSNADAARNTANAAQTAQSWAQIGAGVGQAGGAIGKQIGADAATAAAEAAKKKATGTI